MTMTSINHLTSSVIQQEKSAFTQKKNIHRNTDPNATFILPETTQSPQSSKFCPDSPPKFPRQPGAPLLWPVHWVHLASGVPVALFRAKSLNSANEGEPHLSHQMSVKIWTKCPWPKRTRPTISGKHASSFPYNFSTLIWITFYCSPLTGETPVVW